MKKFVLGMIAAVAMLFATSNANAGYHVNRVAVVSHGYNRVVAVSNIGYSYPVAVALQTYSYPVAIAVPAPTYAFSQVAVVATEAPVVYNAQPVLVTANIYGSGCYNAGIGSYGAGSYGVGVNTVGYNRGFNRVVVIRR